MSAISENIICVCGHAYSEHTSYSRHSCTMLDCDCPDYEPDIDDTTYQPDIHKDDSQTPKPKSRRKKNKNQTVLPGFDNL